MAWLDRLRELLGVGAAGTVGPGGVRWLGALESPFGVEVLDCTGLTQGAPALPGEPETAERWLEQRQSDGSEQRGCEPADARTVPCTLSYPQEGTPADGAVFKSEVLEDRWDVFLWDGALHFVRSWSGTLVYRARVEFADGRLHVRDVTHPGGEPADLAVREVDFLIRSHLFGQLVAHPLPAGSVEDAETLAQASFARFGRRCRFGTFADTTTLPPLADHRPEP